MATAKIFIFNSPNKSTKATCVPAQRPQQVKNEKRRGTSELTGKQLTSPVRHHHHTAPSCQLDRWRNERVESVGWTPRPHHHQKAQSVGERAPVPLPQSNSSTKKKNPLPLNLFEKTKKSQNSISVCLCACACVHMCMSECVPCFFYLFFSFLAWCQMFQLSTAVQHRWWWI